MPTQAQIVAFADAFTAFLNAGTFAIPFTAQRAYASVYDRDKLTSNLIVTVCPRLLSEELVARTEWEENYIVGVGIQRIIDITDVPTLDSLMLLVDQIRDLMRFQSIGGCGWQKTDVEQLFDAEKAVLNREFSAIINFTFMTVRS